MAVCISRLSLSHTFLFSAPCDVLISLPAGRDDKDSPRLHITKADEGKKTIFLLYLNKNGRRKLSGTLEKTELSINLLTGSGDAISPNYLNVIVDGEKKKFSLFYK